MRATLRITWLLLSLSFLFHISCSDDVSQSATSVSKDAASVTSAPTVVPPGGSASGIEATTGSKSTAGTTQVAVATGAPPTGDTVMKKSEPTQAPTPAKPTAAVTTSATTVTATIQPTVKPVPTQPPAPTITDKPAPPPTSNAGAAGATPAVVNDATPPAATPSLPKTMTPSVPAGSSGSSVVSLDVATTQTPETTVPSKTPPVGLPGHTDNVGTTKIPKVSTDALTTRQQSMVHTTVTSKTSQEASSGEKNLSVIQPEGTEKITVTVTSHVQTASRAPEPSGTTSNPSTLTKAGPPAAETFGTKAGSSSLQTTTTPSPTTSTTTTTTTTTTIAAQPKTFLYSLNNGHEKEEEKELAEVCRRLMANLQDGNCTLTWRHRNDKIQFDCVEINGKVKTNLATQYYEEITKKPTDNKTLIAILASCGALLIMIVILAVCASHHRKPYSENQQHLTEELHTVENGYHDNPTLEVMEVQPEMQEKKMALNGEFNDSWIVPIDNLLKEDIPDEEDTHL